MAARSGVERYRTNFRAEREGALFYQELAKAERDTHLAELYRRMSETGHRYAALWAACLRSAGQPEPTYTPGWRIRTLILLAKRFGVSSVLPMISTMERDYEGQPEARAAGMPAQERSHDAALDTLAREELGIDPQELDGSAWEASITSFLLFAVGAIVPVIPFAFGSGWMAVLVSLLLGIPGLSIVGIGITLSTGAPLLKSGGRQVLLGVAASAITFALGWLVGGRLG